MSQAKRVLNLLQEKAADTSTVRIPRRKLIDWADSTDTSLAVAVAIFELAERETNSAADAMRKANGMWFAASPKEYQEIRKRALQLANEWGEELPIWWGETPIPDDTEY